MNPREIPDWLKTAAKITLVVGLLGEIVAVFVLPRIGEPEGRSESASVTNAEAGRVTNNIGGYSVRPPSTWKVKEQGAITRLIQPGKGIVVSMGPGEGNDVGEIADRLASTLEANYEDVLLGPERSRLFAGYLALVRDGTAVNENRVRLRVRTVAIEGPRQSYAIVSFSRARWPQTRAAIGRILRSFRPFA